MAISAHDLLARSGWTADRRVEVGHVVQFLLEQGYDVVAPFENFATQYLGLRITSSDGRALRFDMDEISALTDEGWCEAYGEEIGRRVTPVGGFGSHMVVLIDETGAFWGAFDPLYGYLGDDILQVIQWTLIDPPTARKLDHRVPD